MNDLTLTIINDGAGYSRRCALGRREFTARVSATDWLWIVRFASKGYEEKSGKKFTAIELLEVAKELAEYYEEHVKEA